jgi:hypothetical protein
MLGNGEGVAVTVASNEENIVLLMAVDDMVLERV